MSSLYFLKGKNLYLRPLTEKDVNDVYLSWLNDKKVNEFSRRSLLPTNEFQAKKYILSLDFNEVILAICKKEDDKHIGNIKFGPIDWINRSADISILIGDKLEWGKGYAGEAIYLVTKHLFKNLGANRIEAGTVNPAFVSVVTKKLGWKEEGKFRKAFFLRGIFFDITRLSLLREEFEEKPQFEED